MIHAKARYLELQGTSYEIGQKLGGITAGIPALKKMQTSGGKRFSDSDISMAKELFHRWCPGMNEEIQGFADILDVAPADVLYYAMTCLKPGCSQVALLPGLTPNRHVLMARSYEFSPRFEDFVLTRTGVRGKYTHISSSVLQFGRDEGMNEQGLGVTMSSCGFPVGALDNMRKPALRGLQFWAVIRTLLENCTDVSEALSFLKGMPIAYNINLLLADRAGHAALVETFDGRMAVKQIDSQGQQQYLHATNHIVLPELKQYEPKAMLHSVTRYEYISKYLDNTHGVTESDLESLLLGKYPEGLCCHYYDDFFGTTKSIIMDLNEGTMALCWGGLESNGWRDFNIIKPLEESTQLVAMSGEKSPTGIFDFIPDLKSEKQ